MSLHGLADFSVEIQAPKKRKPLSKKDGERFGNTHCLEGVDMVVPAYVMSLACFCAGDGDKILDRAFGQSLDVKQLLVLKHFVYDIVDVHYLPKTPGGNKFRSGKKLQPNTFYRLIFPRP